MACSDDCEDKTYIDCHCHLYSDEFKQDIETVIQQAKEVGVAAILVVPENLSYFQKTFDLAEKFPDIVAPCLGVHPVQGDEQGEARSAQLSDLDGVLTQIEEHQEKLFAIGECGLDFTPRFIRTPDDKDSQKAVLQKQIELAKKFDIPVNVHSRSAGRPTIAFLQEQGVQKALLHAFDGKASVAMEGVKAGYFFSIPPSIVRSGQEKLVKQLPIENILLETDAPALGPEKQVRNVPANVKISCEYIAKIKNMEMDEVRRITTNNALKLFPKLKRFLSK